MRRYQLGDEVAFRCLFARYGSPIYRYFLHRTGHADLARDCAQTMWLKLHKSRATYRSPQAVRPWLYAIAANLRIDEARARLRSRETLTRDGSLPEPSLLPAQARPEDDRDEAVRRALMTLPDDARNVIVLHRFHDLGFAEIATLLGQSESAVKVRAHRAYLQLRKTLLSGRNS